MFNCIPLTCKHITSLKEKWEDSNLINIISNKVQFKHCLVYGKIMSRGNAFESSYNYIIDDGTDSLNISLFRKTSDIEKMWKMENELQAAKKELLTQNKNEIFNSLRNLLFKTKEQIDYSNLPIGSKILVYGRPTSRKSGIYFKVYCFIEDSKSNRDIEIYFKDYLIDWHKSNCIFLTNS